MKKAITPTMVRTLTEVATATFVLVGVSCRMTSMVGSFWMK